VHLYADLLLSVLMIYSIGLDDILLDDHVVHVKSILHVLRKERLFANLKKCTFYTDKLVFLGFLVSAQGI
jgi:hypothetical protein